MTENKKTSTSWEVLDTNKERLGIMTGKKGWTVAKKAGRKYAKEHTKDNPKTILLRRRGTKSYKKWLVWVEETENTFITEFRPNPTIMVGVCKYVPKNSSKTEEM